MKYVCSNQKFHFSKYMTNIVYIIMDLITTKNPNSCMAIKSDKWANFNKIQIKLLPRISYCHIEVNLIDIYGSTTQFTCIQSYRVLV